MTRHIGRVRTALTVLLAWCALVGVTLAAAPHAAAGSTGEVRYAEAEQVAPGLSYREFSVSGSQGTAHGHLLTVDLRDRRVSVDLLHPGAVGARAPVSQLADSRGAVAGVNGDFYNISETQHPGVEPTFAPVGPAIASGRHLKAAVPDGQRFGPALPPGTTTEDVIGVGADRRARLDRLTLRGTVTTPQGTRRLGGLNQYALPVGGIGAFTPEWGVPSRVRATCGTDTDRAAPCSTDTHEVTVSRGRVVSSADTPGSGPVAAGSVVLVGREAGAQTLRKLGTGDRVRVRHRLAATASYVPYRFAIGGFPILRDGLPLAGLDHRTAAIRTAAGIGAGGRRLHLLALDGAVENRPGVTISELAALMHTVGADDAINLDGGGSSTLVLREPGAAGVTVRNHPSGGAERPVPDGIGVFSRP
ncbi:phosphodiester glycosidase family protein [Streptomyces sp. NPDC004647]|uniref:phosphodiester glycosidase family protein n=1 Tax=Streptomyces sp. NPDC004647 TaxID=3154671 RepID=UPI0033B1C073